MSKMKKILISLGAFIVATFTKISGLISRAMLNPAQTLYGIPQNKYRSSQPITREMITNIAKPPILVVAFIIGLFVILSKKITKKVKAIVVSVLVIAAILGYILMNYFSTNF